MPRLGILGGDQLAKMTAQAASVLDIETVIFAQNDDEPALKVTPYHQLGRWDDHAALEAFTAMCDVVTVETPSVDPAVLERIEAAGIPVYASSATLAQVQDKWTQKRTMQSAGVTTPRFRKVTVATDLLDAAQEFGFPLIVRVRRDGADGYGSTTIRRAHDIEPALQRFAGRDLMVEESVPFVRELAVMMARSPSGDIRAYPVVEMVQQDGICHTVRCPAAIDEATAYRTVEMAQQAIEAIDGVGVFGVEMYELEDGDVLCSAVVPGPHDAGHYTIEGTITSQFENHVRAVMGLPLGDVAQIAPATVMVNVLGQREGEPNPEALKAALATEGVHIHLYGKPEVRPGRKMGHITVLGYNTDGAEQVARLALSRMQL